MYSHGVDEPASGFGVGHLNSFWHNQFLKGDGMISAQFITTKSQKDKYQTTAKNFEVYEYILNLSARGLFVKIKMLTTE